MTVAAYKMKTGTVAEKLQDLRERERKVKEMGGAAAVAAQHERGKLTARERIDLLFDPGTFLETDMFMKHRGTLFGIQMFEERLQGEVPGGKVPVSSVPFGRTSRRKRS